MNIQCAACGKFISYAAIDAGEAKFEFTPDSHFGPEESEWVHRACDSGRLPKGEDAGTAAECEASQSGLSDSEGIAHTPPDRRTP